jgi:hypothetical protein
VPRKPKAKEPEPDGDMPWGWIVGVPLALLALGGGAAVLMRRKKPRNADIPAPPGLLDRLKQRLAARKKTAPAKAAEPVHEVEPSLE